MLVKSSSSGSDKCQENGDNSGDKRGGNGSNRGPNNRRNYY